MIAGRVGVGGLRREDLVVGAADDALAREVEALGEVVVDQDVAPAEVLDEDERRRVVEDVGQPPDRLLEVTVRGDVVHLDGDRAAGQGDHMELERDPAHTRGQRDDRAGRRRGRDELVEGTGLPGQRAQRCVAPHDPVPHERSGCPCVLEGCVAEAGHAGRVPGGVCSPM